MPEADARLPPGARSAPHPGTHGDSGSDPVPGDRPPGPWPGGPGARPRHPPRTVAEFVFGPHRTPLSDPDRPTEHPDIL